MRIGGFDAVFTQQSVLAKIRTDLINLPTTSGDHCIGDGIKMGEAVGAKAVDLEWVQVHPTVNEFMFSFDYSVTCYFCVCAVFRRCMSFVVRARMNVSVAVCGLWFVCVGVCVCVSALGLYSRVEPSN